MMKKLVGHVLNVVRGYGKPYGCKSAMVLLNCLENLTEHSRTKEEQVTPNRIHEEITPHFDFVSRVCPHKDEQSLQRSSKGKWLVVSCISDSGRPIPGSCLCYYLYNGAIKIVPCRSFASSANSWCSKSQAFSHGLTDKVSLEKRVDKEDSELELKRQHNCWRLWQQHGFSISDVAFSLKCDRETVLNYIFSCVRQGNEVDWIELCKEVELTPEIANAILIARGKAKKMSSSDKANGLGLVEIQKFCPRSVTTIHIRLVHVMLGCGILPDDIVHTIIIANKDPLTAAEDPEVGNEMYQYKDEDGSIKKIVTESGMLQWLKKNNGATLSQIVDDFRDCDEIYLMRLILYLEEGSLIFRNEGKFRVNLGKLINSSSLIVYQKQ